MDDEGNRNFEENKLILCQLAFLIILLLFAFIWI